MPWFLGNQEAKDLFNNIAVCRNIPNFHETSKHFGNLAESTKPNAAIMLGLYEITLAYREEGYIPIFAAAKASNIEIQVRPNDAMLTLAVWTSFSSQGQKRWMAKLCSQKE